MFVLLSQMLIVSFCLPGGGTPRTLLEAACLGKPIITTDVPGCRETVIHNFNGYLCEAKNAYNIADKMQRMICLDKGKLAEMGVNNN